MSTYTLYFDKVSSYYEQEAKLEEPVNMLDEHITVSTVNTDKLYKNIKDKVSLLQKESMNKDYLISDSLRKWDWKLENETKKIGDYTCYKAIATYTVKDQSFTFTNMSKKEMKENDIDEKTANVIKDVVIEKTVTAWYTPDIPVSHGPGDYWGLPGLILEVTEGKITLMCSKITLNPKKKFEVKVPRKGEKITKADYEVLSKKKLEEMMEMMQQNNKG
jgi:GLPGLI family protein